MDKASAYSRRSVRLKGYDYAQAGAYFVTICTTDRACLFGAINAGAMDLNDAGRMVATIWSDLPARFPGIDIDVFVVMPNHLHGIVVLREDASVGAPLVGARLGAIVGAFKSITTVEYGRGARTHGWAGFRGRLWQRNYYEHVVRDEADLSRVRRYVEKNPLRWEFDDENPDRDARPGDGALPEP